MEWADFAMDETLYGLLSSPLEPEQKSVWTPEENKLFENALAEVDPTSPSFFENVASRVPWKSIEEIKIHYQALVEDVEMIESGRYPVPDYNTTVNVVREKQDQEKEMAKKGDEASPSNEEPKSKTSQQRRRGVPWTEEEHQLFLMGLNKYGKGDWRSISRYYVISKTPTQVASHAQKYFRRQTSATPADRRRPSIHDIQTVSPTPFTSIITQRNTNSFTNVDQVLPFSPHGIIPMLHHNFNSGGAHVEQTPVLLPPMTSTFQSGDPMFNHSAYHASSPYLFPSMRNQQWG